MKFGIYTCIPNPSYALYLIGSLSGADGSEHADHLPTFCNICEATS